MSKSSELQARFAGVLRGDDKYAPDILESVIEGLREAIAALRALEAAGGGHSAPQGG